MRALLAHARGRARVAEVPVGPYSFTLSPNSSMNRVESGGPLRTVCEARIANIENTLLRGTSPEAAPGFGRRLSRNPRRRT